MFCLLLNLLLLPRVIYAKNGQIGLTLSQENLKSPMCYGTINETEDNDCLLSNNADRIFLDYSINGTFDWDNDYDCFLLGIAEPGELVIIGKDISNNLDTQYLLITYGTKCTVPLELLGSSTFEVHNDGDAQVLRADVTPGIYCITIWQGFYIPFPSTQKVNPISGHSYQFTAYMSTPITSVSLNKRNIEMNPGDSQTLTATIEPCDALNQSLSWSSSNLSVATVNCNGLVSAVGSGSATITVTTEDGNKTANCLITVNEPNVAVSNVTINQNNLTMEKGNVTTLIATIFPGNATNQTVIWYSTDTSVAKVNNGLVTALGEGTASIIALSADGSKNASCQVTVRNVSSINWHAWEEKENVSSDKIWTVKFNEKIQSSTINSNNIFVATDITGNNKVAGIIVVPDSSDSTCTLLFPPSGGWEAEDSYYLFISTGIKSTDGTSLSNAIRMKFTIE